MEKTEFVIGPEYLIRLGFPVKECIEFLENVKARDITPARVKALQEYKAYCSNCRIKAACSTPHDGNKCLTHAG